MMLDKWNPSIKCGTVLIAVILLSFEYLVSLNILVFVTSMVGVLLFSNAKPRTVVKILIPATIAGLGLFLMGLYYARGNSVTSVELDSLSSAPYMVRAAMSQNLYTGLQLSTRLMAFAGLGILFALTTDGEYFISSLMHQCHLPAQFAYGILAAFHLMPNMVKEYRNVRIAFEVRGVKSGPLSYNVLFTMLVNSIRWSESVAMAMESKGFCGTARRTYYSVPRVKFSDWLLAAGLLLEIILGMIFLSY